MARSSLPNKVSDRERWTVVDAGDGEIALHNEQTGRFLMISDQHIWGHPAAASHLEEEGTFWFFGALQPPIKFWVSPRKLDK